MDQATLAQLKIRLEKERDKLVEELKSIATRDPRMKGDWDAKFPVFEPQEHGSHSSLEEEASEVESYESMLEAEHSLESRLLEVNKALERIKNGTHGICRVCKKEIPPERLNANPAADADIEHS